MLDRSRNQNHRMRSPKRRSTAGTNAEKQTVWPLKSGENPAQIFQRPRVTRWMEAEIGVGFGVSVRPNLRAALDYWFGWDMVVGSSRLDTLMTKVTLCQWTKTRPPRFELEVGVGHVTAGGIRGLAPWMLWSLVGLGLRHWDARHAGKTVGDTPEFQRPKEMAPLPNLALRLIVVAC